MSQVKQNLKEIKHIRKGEKTLKTILKTAMDMASVDGLEGLSIGSLARRIGMSKSGLFAHFGSKEELQLAIITAARKLFYKEVIGPARKEETGIIRLWKFFDNWLLYLERSVFKGGCFFAAASYEFDSRPGPVRDKIAYAMEAWNNTLKREVERAQQKKQIKNDVEPSQFAFEIMALAMGANQSFQLHNNIQACNQARIAILNRLEREKDSNAPLLPSSSNYQ
jgi:AcrR family transcriptional regulator